MTVESRADHIARGCAVCQKQTVCYYRGRDAETLTREELLVAYRHACDALESERHWARQTADMDRLFADTAAILKAQRREVPNPSLR